AKREEVLKEMGVTQQDLAQTVGIDKDVPYLLNMNEDPALAGKMMYFLPPGQPIKIGAHADNKIVLQGLGVPDYLCDIENLGEQGVVVRTCQQPHTSRLSMKARVCVNGSAMTGDEQRKLKVLHFPPPILLNSSSVTSTSPCPRLCAQRLGAGHEALNQIHAADKCNSTVGNTVAGPCGCTWEDKAKELQAHELAFKRLTLIQLDALCMQGGLDQLKPLPLHLGEQLEPLDELDWSEGRLFTSGISSSFGSKPTLYSEFGSAVYGPLISPKPNILQPESFLGPGTERGLGGVRSADEGGAGTFLQGLGFQGWLSS
ncbi:Kif28p, partial [Symbiodinium sp. KB8]